MKIFFFILSLSVSVAAIIGIIRFRVIHKSYYPFILYLCAATVNEILYFTLNEQAGIITYNVFTVVEFLLYVRLFDLWGVFGQNNKRGMLISGIGVLLWLLLSFVVQSFHKENYVFRLCSYFVLIICSVSVFNRQIVRDQIPIWRNSRFLICLGSIVVFAFGVFVNATNLALFGLNFSKAFYRNVFQIFAYINFAVNLIFALAVLWAPENKKFTRVF